MGQQLCFCQTCPRCRHRVNARKSRNRVPQVLPILPASKWRSRGKVLDYAGWEARERFRELDQILLAAA